MRMDKQTASFELTGHFELAQRGAFVVGHLRDGVCRIGMSVTSDIAGQTYVISGIEYLDNISERKFWSALIFREKPAIAEIERAFPAGTLLSARMPSE